MAAVLYLVVLQRCSCQDARIASTINDQIESLRLAQSYTNVTGLLNEVVFTANSGKNEILGTDLPHLLLFAFIPINAQSYVAIERLHHQP